MNNQFQRFELLIGEEALASLKNKRVAVFGLGGVGGNVCVNDVDVRGVNQTTESLNRG